MVQSGANQVSARFIATISACIGLAGCAITLVPGDTQWANGAGPGFLLCDPQALVCEDASGVAFDVAEGSLPDRGFQLIGGLRVYPATVLGPAYTKARTSPGRQLHFDQKWARVKLYLQQQPSIPLGTGHLFFSPHPPLFPPPVQPSPAQQAPAPRSHVDHPAADQPSCGDHGSCQ